MTRSGKPLQSSYLSGTTVSAPHPFACCANHSHDKVIIICTEFQALILKATVHVLQKFEQVRPGLWTLTCLCGSLANEPHICRLRDLPVCGQHCHHLQLSASSTRLHVWWMQAFRGIQTSLMKQHIGLCFLWGIWQQGIAQLFF